MIFFQILLTLLCVPLLFVLTFVNTEYIFQNDFSNSYTLIYSIYLCFAGIASILFRYIKGNDGVFKKEFTSTLRFILYFSVLVLPAVWATHYFILGSLGGTGLYFRAYGKVAYLYLVFALSVSPLLTFIKNKNFAEKLILVRKTLGIISFIFFLKHGLEYFSMEYLFSLKNNTGLSYLGYVYKNLIERYDALTGVVAGLLMFVLGITSNKMSMTIFSGKRWKNIQSLVYPAFLLSSLHVAFASRFDIFYIVLVVWLVYIRTAAYIATKDKPTSGPTTKYICKPCGYIYDEAVGDPDSGIDPGTLFAAIPDSRVCPVCGVKKADFEPYYEIQNAVFSGYIAQVVGHTMLTKNILELSLKIDTALSVLPGQYVLVCLKDFDGEFTRSYSVVQSEGATIQLGIRLNDTGRGGRTLKNLKIGDTLKIKGVYGSFVLKNTPNPKVFLATGTGLSPLYNMIMHNTFSSANMLLWGVAKKEDVFYEDALRHVKDMQVDIFLSEENVAGYTFGRVDASVYDFPKNTEFYICGNPAMVTGQIKILKEKGYELLYTENF